MLYTGLRHLNTSYGISAMIFYAYRVSVGQYGAHLDWCFMNLICYGALTLRAMS